MNIRALVQTVCVTTALLLVSSAAVAQNLDQYGGYTDLPVPGGATGYFRMAKLGTRWVLASPSGNAFWMRSVYGVDITDGGRSFVRALQIQYGHSDWTNPDWVPWSEFVTHAANRLKSWGFNTIGEYSSNYAWPIVSYSRGWSNPIRMPFIRMVQSVIYGETWNKLKDIQYGLDPTKVNGSNGVPALWYASGFPDVFDPNFPAIVNTYALDRQMFPTATTLTGSPWVVGTSLDDRDYLFGFGSSRAFGGWHEHLGWTAAATSPNQNKNTRIWAGATQGVTYTDTVVYSKYAWRDFLRAKYGTVAALNTAWGSSYTTWDSDGGWPNGQGVLDESGRGKIGKDYYKLSDAAPAAKADLDQFLEQLCDRYFATVAAAVRAADPNHLVFSPMALSPAAFEQVLRSAGKYLDVIQIEGSWSDDILRRAYDLTKKPLFVWSTLTSQTDSALAGNPGWGAGIDFPTQADRGQAYANLVKRLLNLKASDGTYPIVGINWWAYTDKITGGESMNFGLTSNKNNAYDGQQAIMAKGIDRWGYPTGGELKNYGDFLSAVIATNSSVASTLVSTPPQASVSFITPLNNSTVQQSVTVAALATGNAAKIALALDGTAVYITTGSSTTYLWNTTTASNGGHSWKATVYDAAGNELANSSITTIVSNATVERPPPRDTTAPTVSLSIQPSRKFLKVSVAAADSQSGIEKVELYLDDKLNRIAATASPWTLTLDTKPLKRGEHSLRAKAYDRAGNSALSNVVTITK